MSGPDLLVRGALATWFGGDDDPQDNGETASGVNTKGNPTLLGCALPMHGFRNVHSTVGSPIPRLPMFTKVEVTLPVKRDGSTVVVTCPLIDIGPSGYTNHPIDLTQQAFKELGGNLRDGRISVDFRILGGAAYLVSQSARKGGKSTDWEKLRGVDRRIERRMARRAALYLSKNLR